MYKSDSMINPSIVDLLTRVENRYSLVIASSKRARKLIDGEKVLVDLESSKPLTLAINEISEDKMIIDAGNE